MKLLITGAYGQLGNEMRVALETAKTQLQDKFIEQNTARLNVVKEEERKKEAEGNFADLKNENEDIEKVNK